MSINKILSYWLCPFGKNWPVANLPAVDVRCQWQEMSLPKPLNMQVLVFLFVFWFSIPSIKWLKDTSCKQYRYFSVLTAIILENSNKWPWIGNGEGFAINLSTWANGTKSKWWVSSWLALSNTHKKISFFFHIGCYGFSKGWKSLYNTVVNMIISNFSQASTWTWSILISIH